MARHSPRCRHTVQYLIDTNVLVYALDAGQPRRRAVARDGLTHLVERQSAALSAQALGELANVCLNRLRPGWPPQRVSEHLGQLTRALTVLPVTPQVVLEALRGVADHRMAYYDAQMWAIARLHQIPNLLTEDMDSGAIIDGVMFLNPFSEPTPFSSEVE